MSNVTLWSILKPKLWQLWKWTLWPKNVILVTVGEQSWCGVPHRRASVLEWFSWRKLSISQSVWMSAGEQMKLNLSWGTAVCHQHSSDMKDHVCYWYFQGAAFWWEEGWVSWGMLQVKLWVVLSHAGMWTHFSLSDMKWTVVNIFQWRIAVGGGGCCGPLCHYLLPSLGRLWTWPGWMAPWKHTSVCLEVCLGQLPLWTSGNEKGIAERHLE